MRVLKNPFVYALSVLLSLAAAEAAATTATTKETRPPVVKLKTVGASILGSASGALLDNWTLATSSHVVQDATEIQVSFPGGGRLKGPIRKYYIEDIDHDVILLAIPEGYLDDYEIRYPRLVSPHSKAPNSTAQISGFPGGDRFAAVEVRLQALLPLGVLYGIPTHYWSLEQIGDHTDHTNLLPTSGLSGGPLGDLEVGELYGLHARRGGPSTLYAISSDVISALLDNRPSEPKLLSERAVTEAVQAKVLARKLMHHIKDEEYREAVDLYAEEGEPEDYQCVYAAAQALFGLREYERAYEGFASALQLGEATLAGEADHQYVTIQLVRADLEVIKKGFVDSNANVLAFREIPQTNAFYLQRMTTALPPGGYKLPSLNEDRIRENGERVDRLLESEEITKTARKTLLLFRAAYAVIKGDDEKLQNTWQELKPLVSAVVQRAQEAYHQQFRRNSRLRPRWFFPESLSFTPDNQARIEGATLEMFHIFGVDRAIPVAISGIVVEATHGDPERAARLLGILQSHVNKHKFIYDRDFVEDLVLVSTLKDLFSHADKKRK